MLDSRKMRVALLASASAVLIATATSASATVTVSDNYLGGENTYDQNLDVIGPTSVFDIQDSKFDRTNGGKTLHVVIDTHYAGVPGTDAADGTGYGAFFITPGANAWNPTGTAPYATDVYQPGQWTYAFALPTAGAGGNDVQLYKTADGAVVMSNVYGNAITYPHDGNPGYYFRQGQAVQFTPGQLATPIGQLGSWSAGDGKIVLDINDNGALGNDFAFSWAMTCGNDVIQGQVRGLNPAPAPALAVWPMLMAGLGKLAGVFRRRRRASGLAALQTA
jgi:hypothetical protein